VLTLGIQTLIDSRVRALAVAAQVKAVGHSSLLGIVVGKYRVVDISGSVNCLQFHSWLCIFHVGCRSF